MATVKGNCPKCGPSTFVVLGKSPLYLLCTRCQHQGFAKK